jgi:hypothetical protein
MRITILAHNEPGKGETFPDLVGDIAASLRKGGHRVAILAVGVEIGRLISGLKRRQPDLVFNLMDMCRDLAPDAVAVLGLLDLLGVPYTGCGPGEIYVQTAPDVAHHLLLSAGLPVANGGQDYAPTRPSNRIAALVKTRPAELTIGVVGNDVPEVFVPINADRLSGALAIEADSQFEDARQLAASAYEVLRGRDYGLVRLTVAADQVEVAGVEVGFSLDHGSDFVQSASAAGVDFGTLINRIAEAALERADGRRLVRLI